MVRSIAGTQIEARNGDSEGLRPSYLTAPRGTDREYWARMAEADKVAMQRLLQDAFRRQPHASRA
jgi:hypothetical protein